MFSFRHLEIGVEGGAHTTHQQAAVGGDGDAVAVQFDQPVGGQFLEPGPSLGKGVGGFPVLAANLPKVDFEIAHEAFDHLPAQPVVRG